MSATSGHLVGSETQDHQTHASCTGVQRVIRETHGELSRLLGEQNATLVPFHTRVEPASERYRRDPYLASDPVLARPAHDLADLDVALFLDLNIHLDFARVFRQRRERRVPTVFMVYDLLAIRHPEWFEPAAREHFRVYLQQLLRVADHIVVTANSVRADLLALGWRVPAEVHVLHLGTSFAQQPPPQVPALPLTLLYVSTVAPRKGHDTLLAAYDILVAQGVDTQLHIVGREGWQIEELARTLRSHPDAGVRIHWHETADDATVRRLAQGSHVAVVPSQDEGFGLFVEEGLSLGLKVVAADIPVLRERPQANLSFCDPTPAGLAAAILDAHATPAQPLAPGAVRTMADFAGDLAALVRSLLP